MGSSRIAKVGEQDSTLTSRGGAAAARWAHNPKVAGSSPAPATRHSKRPSNRGALQFHRKWRAWTDCIQTTQSSESGRLGSIASFTRMSVFRLSGEGIGRELLDGRDLNSGLDWPDNLLSLLKTRKWPEYSFGSANASCLVVLHRPGDTSANTVEDTFISPTYRYLVAFRTPTTCSGIQGITPNRPMGHYTVI